MCKFVQARDCSKLGPPPQLEARKPLVVASPDAVGFAVATALQQRANPSRVAHWVGTGASISAHTYNCPSQGAFAVFAEYMPADTTIAREIRKIGFTAERFLASTSVVCESPC